MAILFNGNVWCGGSSGHGQCDLPDHLLPEALFRLQYKRHGGSDLTKQYQTYFYHMSHSHFHVWFLMFLSCQAPEIPEVSEVESDIFSDGAEEGEEELPEAGSE